MVQEEGGVIWRRERVSRLATDSSITGSVHPQKAIRKPALEFSLERENGMAGVAYSDVDEIRGGHPLDERVGAQVASQATGVVSKLAFRICLDAAHARSDGSDVDGHARNMLAVL